MKRALVVITALATAALLTILGRISWLSNNRGPDVHKARGYELIAQLFLTHRWLQFDEQSTQITLAPRQDTTAAGAIFRRSFLRPDVEAFNGGARSVFRVENQFIVGVDATRHNVILPYGKVDLWKGALRFRRSGQTEASLRGVGIDLQLTGLTRNLLEYKAPDVIIRDNRNAEPLVTARDQALNIFGSPHVFLGKVYLIGQDVVVNNRQPPASVSMWIGGERIQPGNRAFLSAGDLLKLEWRPGGLRRSRYALLWSEGGRSADTISTPCAINGHWGRCPDHPAPPLAADIIATLDSAVAGRQSGVRDDFDIVLTLDRELNRKTQRALEAFRNQPVLQGGGEVASRRRMTRSAVTVMNALNGEILALASYPTEAALSRVDLPTAVESRLLRNHNFTRMPVGSVAKVLFSAAIFDADPRLITLRLRQHAGTAIDSVAGIHVEPPIESHPVETGSDGLVDYPDFIGHSSNEYAAVLLTLACATKAGEPLPTFAGALLPQEGRYSIAGTKYDHAPSAAGGGETRLKLTFDANNNVVGGTQSALEGEPWADSFRRLFDVEKVVTRPIDARSPALGDGVIDTAVWQPVLAEVYGSRVPQDQPFRAVGFERENLALNLSYNYRTQLLSLMYGGAAARFTNPKLCEMFSRLVTGRKVERSLVQGVAQADGDPQPVQRRFAPLGLDDRIRGEVLDAMTGVVRHPSGSLGTAKNLYSLLREIDAGLATKQEALGFFSKTGSPRNTITVPNRLAKAVNELIASGAVALNADGVMTYRGIVVAENGEENESASLRALLDNQADRRILRKYRVGVGILHSALVLYNVETPENRARVFVVAGGRVVRMNAVREISTTGAVYVFTMGIYPRAARRSDQPLDIDAVHHQPLRAYSVAINIEGQGMSTDVAVPFAKSLIRDVLWPALERHP